MRVPPIKLSRQGVTLSVSEDVIRWMAAEFAINHYVHLSKLIDTASLTKILSRVNQLEFKRCEHEDVGAELCNTEASVTSSMNLLLNNSDLFRFVERVTGCEAIGSFTGRIYRYLPDEDHYDHWHDDLSDSRLVALSINLSSTPYQDGLLEIREAKSKRIVQRIANNGYGDALLFRISDALEHRRTPVSGQSPKTALAGWFKATPNFLESIKATA